MVLILIFNLMKKYVKYTRIYKPSALNNIYITMHNQNKIYISV